jgi:hypothetical protein
MYGLKPVPFTLKPVVFMLKPVVFMLKPVPSNRFGKRSCGFAAQVREKLNLWSVFWFD